MRGTRSEGGILGVESGVVSGAGVGASGKEGVESGALGAQPKNASNISADTTRQSHLIAAS